MGMFMTALLLLIVMSFVAGIVALMALVTNSKAGLTLLAGILVIIFFIAQYILSYVRL